MTFRLKYFNRSMLHLANFPGQYDIISVHSNKLLSSINADLADFLYMHIKNANEGIPKNMYTNKKTVQFNAN